MEKKIEEKEISLIKEMAEFGLHFGRKRSFIHPQMKGFIGGLRGNIFLIDLFKTEEKLKEVLEFIGKSVKEGKKILFVGTKIPARKVIEETARACHFPYINERWIGGFFTNFENVLERVKKMNELEKKINSGELERYSKKERARIEKEFENLKKKFGGLKEIECIPDIIFIVSPNKEKYCVKEAKEKGLQIVAIGNLETNPQQIDYLIPANDNAISSLKYILEKVKEVIIKNKKK